MQTEQDLTEIQNLYKETSIEVDGEGFIEDLEKLFNEAFGSPKGSIKLAAFCEKYKKNKVYIPSGSTLYSRIRNKIICQLFDGNNYDTLAALVKLTPRHIKRIISKGRKKVIK
ncbi:MAG: hypothetical protein KAS32_16095 [Candidatus Peribacteraceae bacterium]|nr:hypothetical protein [Candidatus Peribacteraceae bacterium]